METPVYLDYAATTPPSEAVIEAVTETMCDAWGNPSSVHAGGFTAAQLLKTARERVLFALGVRYPRPGQLVFTASGTESDNLAILGVARAKHYDSPHFITTDSEHPAVMQCTKHLESIGWRITYLSTNKGVLNLKALENALSPSTVLVSIMAANNETGAAYDLKQAFSLVKRYSPRILTHTDAVQAFGKIPIFPEKLGADLVTVSAHKIHGIKGAGALYLSPDALKRRAVKAQILGGGQEHTLRSGTEAVPAIAGFGTAAKAITPASLASSRDRSFSLRSHLLSIIDSRVTVNQPAGDFLPSTLSLTLPEIKSEVMLRHLSAKGFFVSAGSACSSSKHTASPVLLAFGLTEMQADCTIRVSFSPDHTEEELTRFASALKDGLDTLTKIRT